MPSPQSHKERLPFQQPPPTQGSLSSPSRFTYPVTPSPTPPSPGPQHSLYVPIPFPQTLRPSRPRQIPHARSCSPQTPSSPSLLPVSPSLPFIYPSVTPNPTPALSQAHIFPFITPASALEASSPFPAAKTLKVTPNPPARPHVPSSPSFLAVSPPLLHLSLSDPNPRSAPSAAPRLSPSLAPRSVPPPLRLPPSPRTGSQDGAPVKGVVQQRCHPPREPEPHRAPVEERRRRQRPRLVGQERHGCRPPKVTGGAVRRLRLPPPARALLPRSAAFPLVALLPEIPPQNPTPHPTNPPLAPKSQAQPP